MFGAGWNDTFGGAYTGCGPERNGGAQFDWLPPCDTSSIPTSMANTPDMTIAVDTIIPMLSHLAAFAMSPCIAHLLGWVKTAGIVIPHQIVVKIILPLGRGTLAIT
jgi:hypothetical protein